MRTHIVESNITIELVAINEANERAIEMARHRLSDHIRWQLLQFFKQHESHSIVDLVGVVRCVATAANKYN